VQAQGEGRRLYSSYAAFSAQTSYDLCFSFEPCDVKPAELLAFSMNVSFH